uniref:SWIM-type domain-containing protein n=1 Tax=Lactuca sativa TaxID=4236 RepID=A0A9R1WTH0_LACSA|nr:hypothetical protein LSAT_V11C100013270 [Lactuca sativa]
MASDSKQSEYLTVYIHYNGLFARKPLVYLNAVVVSICDVDFGAMDFKDFNLFIAKLIEGSCDNVYYCTRNEPLAEGIRRIRNDADYFEFIETGYSDEAGLRMNVYIDHENEPVLDWADMEVMEDDEGHYSKEDLDDDKDSQLSDDVPYEHEADDYIPSLDKTIGDEFLHRVSGMCKDIDDEAETDEVETKNGDDKPVYPIHNENQKWDKMVPILGMRFSNPMELKNCLTNYAVKNGYNLYFEKNDSQRLLVRCCKENKNPSCPFRPERSFQIKSLVDEHNCSRVFKLGSIVTFKWIGMHFKNQLVKNPKMSIRKMKAKVSTKFNLIVSVTQCRNARRYALDEIEGSLIEHYGKVWSYGEEIMRTNPGSTVKIDVNVMPDSTTYFSKMYVCFKGVKDGWIAACRRVIGVDGCFLKGICRGQLLAAMGRDANNHIFPIAWAVVEVENKETWKWFLDLLLDDIEMGIGHGLTLISDQHKGLIEVVKERVPAAEHRQCARHIYANFKKRFKGEQYRKLFWAAAASTTQPKFEAEMNSIKKLTLWLMNTSWKGTLKVGAGHSLKWTGLVMLMRMAYQKVSTLKRPLITMLEEIRIYAMERMYKMLQEGQSWGNLKICPSIRLKISKLKKQQRFWGVIPSGIQQYEVRIGNDGYAVDLNNNTCGCRSWQVSGIPCVHAVAAISYLNRNAEDYVAPWFHTTMFFTCYNHTINPLNGSSMWPEAPYMKPLPPQKRRLPGRPTLKRKKDQSEMESKGKTRHTISKAGSVNRCTIRRERGHNRSTCPTRPADVASTSRPKNKKPKKCKKEKGKVEPVQVDPVQADPVDPVQVPAPQVDPVQADLVDPVQVPAPQVDPVQADPVDPIQVPAPHVEPVQEDPVDPLQVPAPHVEPVQADPMDPVDVPAPHVEPVQVDDPHPDVDVPAQPVATRQRIRKYSERITKIGLRRKVLKK